MKIAVVVHAFYEEELRYLCSKLEEVLLSSIQGSDDVDIIITIPQSRAQLGDIVHHLPKTKVVLVDNLGMDILPFIQLIPSLLQYDWIMKLHTKKGEGELGHKWFMECVDAFVGDRYIFEQNVEILKSHPEWAMAGLLPFFLSSKRLQFSNDYQSIGRLWQVSINREWGFFAGSFFWIKPQAVAEEFKLINSRLFSASVKKDGGIEHTIERMISLLILKKGEIGLFLPSLNQGGRWLVLSSKDAIPISQALTQDVLRSYVSLREDIAFIKHLKLFDIKRYQELTSLQFENATQAIQHYLLYGRYAGLSSCVDVFHRKLLNNEMVNWGKEKSKLREQGMVSVIIPVFNQFRLTARCIQSILKNTKNNHYEIILVNNGSTTKVSILLKIIAIFSRKITLVNLKRNFGFSIACNVGFSCSQGEYCVFLNNDTEVSEGWLEPLIALCKQEDILAVQPKLLYMDGRVQSAGVVFGQDGFGVSYLEGKENSEEIISGERVALTAACLVIKSEDFISVNGFNPLYINGQEDVDLCLRLKEYHQTRKLWFCAESIVYHHTSRSRGRKKCIQQNRTVFSYFWSSKIMQRAGKGVNSPYLALGNRAYYRGLNTIARELYLRAVKTVPILRESLLRNIGRTFEKQGKEVCASELEELLRNSKVESDNFSFLSAGNILNQQYLQNMVNVQLLEPGFYHSSSNDPYFLIEGKSINIEKGFYVLSFFFLQENEGAQQFAKIYVDYGNDFSEKNSISLIVHNGYNSRVVYFEDTPIGLKFDPAESEGDFLLIDFRLDKAAEGLLNNYFDQVFHDFKLPAVEGSVQDKYTQYDKTKRTMVQDPYKLWIAKNEKDVPTKEEVQQLLKHFEGTTLFSVVIPTYNTDGKYLRECLDSILNQRFNNVEICIADDNSTKQETTQVLREYDEKYNNVKVVFRPQNGHICAATNSALRIASGKYIVLVDHDDVLAKDALFYVAQMISKHPDAKIIYSDEDKIDSKGHRYAPHFKSDWNYDLLLSQNYISHLGVYEHSVIKKIGGFRENAQVEGSQDYDLLLRCLPHVQDKEIAHIPRVLYHWRAIAGSTATSAGEKSYTTDAGIKALQNYFHLIGRDDVTIGQGKLANTYKVNWGMKHQPKVSLLIPTRDKKNITEVAVRSILEKTTYPNYEIIILDNGSVEPETLAFFEIIQRESQKVKVLRYDYPFNYSAINNFGVKHTDGEIIGLVNNDVEVINPEWLTEMVSHALRPEIGCVGAKLYYSNDSIQHAGVILGIQGVAGHSHKYFNRGATGYFSRLSIVQNVSAVTAACLLVRRSVYDAVDGLNEEDLKVAFNDVDFCLKVREAGFRNLWTPYAELYHYESISRGAEDNPEKVARFNKEIEYMKKRWGDLLSHDPYYSPNLTLRREDFSINAD